MNAISLTAREEPKGDNISVGLVYPYITKTNFHSNLLNGEPWKMEESKDRPPFDTAEFVAEKFYMLSNPKRQKYLLMVG